MAEMALLWPQHNVKYLSMSKRNGAENNHVINVINGG
jgi:hypothetical protein